MTNDHCEHCGATLESTANFCSECGEPVADSDGWGASSRDAATDTWGGSYETTREKDTTLAAITHVLGLVTWIIGPLIVFIAVDDEFVEENARNAVNWQIMFTIYSLLAFLLVFVFVGIVFPLAIPLLVLLFLVLPFLNLAVCVIAAIEANDGEAWTYPATPDLI